MIVNRQKVLCILKKTSFLLVVTKFLLECSPKLIKAYNFGQNAINSKTKMNNIVQLGCLFSKLPRLFVNFLSAIVSIFYCVIFWSIWWLDWASGCRNLRLDTNNFEIGLFWTYVHHCIPWSDLMYVEKWYMFIIYGPDPRHSNKDI